MTWSTSTSAAMRTTVLTHSFIRFHSTSALVSILASTGAAIYSTMRACCLLGLFSFKSTACAMTRCTTTCTSVSTAMRTHSFFFCWFQSQFIFKSSTCTVTWCTATSTSMSTAFRAHSFFSLLCLFSFYSTARTMTRCTTTSTTMSSTVRTHNIVLFVLSTSALFSILASTGALRIATSATWLFLSAITTFTSLG